MGLMREQYSTAVPGRAQATITKLARTSACCWARQPAIVIGPVAPSDGQGSEWKGAPDRATATMAPATLSVKVSGLTGDTLIARVGRNRNDSIPPQQAAAISTT